MDVAAIKAQAEKEIAEEKFRAAVEQYKEKLRKKKWWDRLFPWRIMFIRKEVL